MSITYAFGWKPPLPDANRALRYYIPKLETLMALPPVWDLDSPSPGPVYDPPGGWDQGQLGRCGPTQLSQLLVYSQYAYRDRPVVKPSSIFIYYVTRMLMGTVDQDSGVDNVTMLKAVAQYGWCSVTRWPDDNSTFTTKPDPASFDAAKARGPKLRSQPVPQSLDAMQACLHETRRPILFGFTVYKSMLSATVAATGDVPDPGPSDTVAGGHDVGLLGWNTSTGRFKLKNQWPGWGKPGSYGTISFGYATNPDLSGDFHTVTTTDARPAGHIRRAVQTPIQQQVDALFAAVELWAPGWAKWPLQLTNGLIDQFLQTHPVPIGGLKAAVDYALSSLETILANRPLIVAALKIANELIDFYLATHGF